MANVMNESVGQPTAEEARTAAAQLVTPDPLTAQLLAKHAANEKLTQAEYGKIGALAAKAKRFFRMGDTAGQPAVPRPGNSPGVGPVASAQASGDSLPLPEPNAGLVQRTTGAILSRLETFARRKLTNAATAAGADPKTVARFDRAACLPADDKALLVELSPDVARELGIDPKRYCLWVFFGVVGLWGSEVWLAVDELKTMKARETQAVAVKYAAVIELLKTGKAADAALELEKLERAAATPQAAMPDANAS